MTRRCRLSASAAREEHCRREKESSPGGDFGGGVAFRRPVQKTVYWFGRRMQGEEKKSSAALRLRPRRGRAGENCCCRCQPRLAEKEGPNRVTAYRWGKKGGRTQQKNTTRGKERSSSCQAKDRKMSGGAVRKEKKDGEWPSLEKEKALKITKQVDERERKTEPKEGGKKSETPTPLPKRY